MSTDADQAELPIWKPPLCYPFRLRVNDYVRLEGKLGRVIRVTEAAAVVLVNQPPREFTTLFDKRVRFCPSPKTVRIAARGLLSSKREYLRMRRESYVFDICAAPFGTSFFFSTRFAVIPVLLYIWQLILVLLLLAGVGAIYWSVMGPFWGALMFVLNIAALFILLRNLAALKLNRLDDFLIQVPVFGIVYETFFRPETYYRIDTRTMYIETVKRIVERKIDEVTGSQGIQLVEIDSLKPRAIGNLAAMLKRWTG